MSVIDVDDILGSSKKGRNHHPAGWDSRRVKSKFSIHEGRHERFVF